MGFMDNNVGYNGSLRVNLDAPSIRYILIGRLDTGELGAHDIAVLPLGHTIPIAYDTQGQRLIQLKVVLKNLVHRLL